MIAEGGRRNAMATGPDRDAGGESSCLRSWHPTQETFRRAGRTSDCTSSGPPDPARRVPGTSRPCAPGRGNGPSRPPRPAPCPRPVCPGPHEQLREAGLPLCGVVLGSTWMTRSRVMRSVGKRRPALVHILDEERPLGFAFGRKRGREDRRLVSPPQGDRPGTRNVQVPVQQLLVAEAIHEVEPEEVRRVSIRLAAKCVEAVGRQTVFLRKRIGASVAVSGPADRSGVAARTSSGQRPPHRLRTGNSDS